MEAEGGGHGVHREWRISGRRKLALVMAVQNVLVTACLLVTLYVFFYVHNQEPASVENVHIQFAAISSVLGNATLQFDHIDSMNMMSLADEKNQKIYVNCTGPYVLYIDMCYKSLNEEEEATGILQLQVEGSRTPVSSFMLQASHEVCRGLHSIAFLRVKEQASLHLYSDDIFKMKRVTVGLSYLLGTGRQCFF